MISSISDADVPYEADWSPYLEVREVYLSSEHRWVPAFKAPYTTIWWSSTANPQPDIRSDRVTWFDNEETVKQSAYRSYFVNSVPMEYLLKATWASRIAHLNGR